MYIWSFAVEKKKKLVQMGNLCTYTAVRRSYLSPPSSPLPPHPLPAVWYFHWIMYKFSGIVTFIYSISLSLKFTLGLPVPKTPKFQKPTKAPKRTKKKRKVFASLDESSESSSESSDDSDMDWIPGVSEEVTKRNKMIKKFAPGKRYLDYMYWV